MTHTGKVKEITFRNEDDILKYAESIGLKNAHIDRDMSCLMTGWFNVYGGGKKLYGHWKKTTKDGYIFGVYEPEELG